MMTDFLLGELLMPIPADDIISGKYVQTIYFFRQLKKNKNKNIHCIRSNDRPVLSCHKTNEHINLKVVLNPVHFPLSPLGFLHNGQWAMDNGQRTLQKHLNELLNCPTAVFINHSCTHTLKFTELRPSMPASNPAIPHFNYLSITQPSFLALSLWLRHLSLRRDYVRQCSTAVLCPCWTNLD